MNFKLFLTAGKTRTDLYWFTLSMVLAFMCLPLQAVSQTFPSSCTSKDLSLVSASLVGGDACNSCTTGATLTKNLVLGINNKTGSTRTSFAFWATLTVTHEDGSTTVSSIHRCAGPIPPTGPLPAFYTGANFGTITYQCGDALVLTDLHLAWTDASPNSTCASINPATINPKCGTLPMIRINAGVNGSFVVGNASCNSGGSMTVSPYGGTAPYSVTANGETHSGIPANGSTTFNNLAPGNYAVVITDANACTITINRQIGAPPGIPVPLSSQTQTSCTSASGICTVTSPVANYVYTLRQGGAIIYTASNGIFPAVAPGSYSLHAASGSCSNTGADVTIDPQPGTPAAPELCVVEPSLCGPATGSVTITDPIGAGYQYSIDNGSSWQASPIFNNVAAGSVTGIRAKSPGGCISDPATCSDSSCQEAKTAVIEPVLQEPEKTVDNPVVQETIVENDPDVDFMVSPVPFSDRLNIRYNFNYHTPVTIDLLDSSGNPVFSKTEHQSANGQVTLDLKARIQKSTVYFIRLTTARGSTTKTLLSSN